MFPPTGRRHAINSCPSLEQIPLRELQQCLRVSPALTYFVNVHTSQTPYYTVRREFSEEGGDIVCVTDAVVVYS